VLITYTRYGILAYHEKHGTSAEQQSQEATLAISIEVLAEKLNPRKFGFSPKMAALFGAILGHDYGVTDSRGARLTSLSITSDGFVVCGSTAHESGAFVGEVSDLERNLVSLLEAAHLHVSEAIAFERVYASRVQDYRRAS
jgi:hypothetical protein